MAYENLKLVYAMMSGDIYLAKIQKDGIMSTQYRRVITDEVLLSATEWMIGNKQNKVSFASNIEGEVHSIYYTNDSDKQKAIENILNEVE